MSLVVNYSFKNLYINNNKFYNLVSKTYSGTLFNKPSINVDGPKKGLKAISLVASYSQYMTTAPFYTTGNGLSFAFWFKADPSNGTYNGRYSRILDFGNGSGKENIIVFFYDGNIGLSLFQGGSEYKKYDTISNITNNTWYHVAWTIDKSRGWNIYVNGILTKTYSDGYYPKSMMRNYQYIGKSNWGVDPYFTGCIADFRVYNTAITQTEVTEIFNKTYDSTLSGQLVDDPPLVTGVSQLYNEIFCELKPPTSDFIECQNCNFGNDTIVYKKTTENSQENCRNLCANESRCTSYSYDFSKTADNCSQYISFPNERYKDVQNVNSGYNVNKFNYKFSDLSDLQKKNVAIKCSDQYLNNMFLTQKNIDLVSCINTDNDNIGNFSKIDTDPKCIYNLYKSNGLNPPSENRVNYIDNPILKISQGDPEIDNYFSTYQNFLEKQVGNSNINNLLNLKNPVNTNANNRTNLVAQSNGDNSEITGIINSTSDSILKIINNPYIEEKFDNKNIDNYSKTIILAIIFILIIIVLIKIYSSWKKK